MYILPADRLVGFMRALTQNARRDFFFSSILYHIFVVARTRHKFEHFILADTLFYIEIYYFIVVGTPATIRYKFDTLSLSQLGTLE